MEAETQKTDVQTQQVIKSSPSHLVLLFLVILGVAALSALGTYYYLKSATPTLTPKYQQVTDQSNSQQNTMEQVSPVSGNTQAMQGWKTYTSDTFNFSVQYPTTYQIINGTDIIKRDNPQMGIPYTFLKITQKESTNDFVLLLENQSVFDAMPTGTYTNKTINGIQFMQYKQQNNFPEIGNCSAYGYIIKRNSSVYNIFTCDTNTTTFDQMLSTFKFTDQMQATPDATAHSLMDAWLNQYKSPSATLQERLLDYTFTVSKTTPNSTGNGFCFSADYSVKPASNTFDDGVKDPWIAGNGQIDKTAGWIYHKYTYVNVNNVTGEYKITRMATSPQCD